MTRSHDIQAARRAALSQIDAIARQRHTPQPGQRALDEHVTAIIKTFERPCCASRLIETIRRHFPGLPVLVCDDSREPLYADGTEVLPGVTWLTLPFELGHTLGAGRNHLIERAATRYVFLCDDDHEFTPQTRLQAMFDFLERSGYDIVGGAQGSDDYGCAVFERSGRRILQRFHAHHGLIEPGVVGCDRVSNTFLGRTEALRRVRWEPHVYAHEHADFFIRATSAGLKIAQMGRTWVEHDRACEPARGLFGRLFGTLLSHRDGVYRKLRMGGSDGASELAAQRRAEELYKRHVLDVHGVDAIDDVYDRALRRDLEALIGKPADPVPA